ncbi:MAG: hypothetical protein WDO70_12285 [Alphaproteobacteria bacterium]
MNSNESSCKFNLASLSECPVLPIAILALAVVGLAGVQVSLAWSDGTVLRQVRENQTQPLAQSLELQAKLDRLAVGTLQLADSGNANAKELVERMKQAGVTINPVKPADGNGGVKPAK